MAMDNKIKSGKDVINDFFAEIYNIPNADKKTVDALVELYGQGKLSDKNVQTLAEAQAANVPVIAYGAFFNTVIDFLIIAFAIFLMLKQVNRFLTKKEARKCPYCFSEIHDNATRCPHCTSELKKE